MKKIFVIFLISLLSFLSANAQRTNLIYSADKLPEGIGMYKVKILKNGNTANVGLNASVGFFCTLYDLKKTKITQTVVPMEYSPQMYIMKGVIEVNNEVVVFLQIISKTGPTLTRYIFDGTTGQLKKNELILTMPMLTKADWAEYYKNTLPEFSIQKDPKSDYYAVGCYDPYNKDYNKRIKIVHYSPQHAIISNAYLPIPEIKYTVFRYVDMHVNEGKSIVISSFASGAKGETNAYFYLSQLKAGELVFKTVKSIETLPYFYGECLFFYNKITNKVLCISTVMGSDGNGKATGYSTNTQVLNLETLALTELITLHSSKVDAKYAQLFSGNHYNGLVQNYSINSKGDVLLLTEEEATYSSTSTNLNSTYTYSQGKEIGITSLSSTGQEKYGELVHYSHKYYSKYESLVYMKALIGQYTYNGMDEYDGTYVASVAATSNNYLLINNASERFEASDKELPNLYSSITTSSKNFTSFIYTFNEAGIVSKEYIFGKPTSAEDAKYCLFNTADYDPATGLYAVIVIEKIKGKKTASVLWMNLK